MGEIKYLIIAILLCATAQAQTLPIRLVIVKHSHATPLQQQQIARAGLARLKEAGVSHPISKIKIVRDSLKKNSISEYVSRIDSWSKLAYRKGWCNYSQQCHLSLPPVFDSRGTDYGGGVAYDVCEPKWLSYSIARAANGRGESRIQTSITSTAHEVGHLDGAEHDSSSANLMHPAALQFGEVKLPWTLFSKELIDICLLEENERKQSRYGFSVRSFNNKIVERLQP